jgi:hypothetical protein
MNPRFRYVTFIAIAASVPACQLGPFHDKQAEVPTAPEPTWGGLGQEDGGAAKADAGAPAPASSVDLAH